MHYKSDLVFYGETAKMILELEKDYKFRHIDTYMIAPIVGFINKSLKEENVNSIDKSIETSVPRNVLNQPVINNKIEFLETVLYLLENFDVYKEECLAEAFKEQPENQKDLIKKKNLYNNYFNGGIEILYRNLINDDPSDKITKIIEMVDKFEKLLNDNNKTLTKILDNYLTN